MLADLGNILGQFLVAKLGQELTDQGHRLTGSLIASLEYQVTEKVAGVTIDFLVDEYGVYLNSGVKASRIPYSRSSGKSGRKSAYIQGLIRYVERRMGLRGREGIGVAFAIARAHRREGMPTSASYRFSKNTRRTGWADAVAANEAGAISEMVAEFVDRQISILLTEYIKAA